MIIKICIACDLIHAPLFLTTYPKSYPHKNDLIRSWKSHIE
jgi:hypothetical protein